MLGNGLRIRARLRNPNLNGALVLRLLGGKEVVVSRKAAEAVLRGAPLYAPGCLACSPGVEVGDLVAVSYVVEQAGRWAGAGQVGVGCAGAAKGLHKGKGGE